MQGLFYAFWGGLRNWKFQRKNCHKGKDMLKYHQGTTVCKVVSLPDLKKRGGGADDYI